MPFGVAKLGMGGQISIAPTPETVIWTSLVNAVDDGGGTIRKTAGGGWSGGGISTKAIQSGNGYVEGTLNDTLGYIHFGLSNGDTDQDFIDVDFAVNTFPAGTLRAWRNGVLKDGNIGTVNNDDVLRVAVESGSVVIRKNGSLLYTFVDSPTYPLLLDCALNVTTTSQIKLCKIQGILV